MVDIHHYDYLCTQRVSSIDNGFEVVVVVTHSCVAHEVLLCECYCDLESLIAIEKERLVSTVAAIYIAEAHQNQRRSWRCQSRSFG